EHLRDPDALEHEVWARVAVDPVVLAEIVAMVGATRGAVAAAPIRVDRAQEVAEPRAVGGARRWVARILSAALLAGVVAAAAMSWPQPTQWAGVFVGDAFVGAA